MKQLSDGKKEKEKEQQKKVFSFSTPSSFSGAPRGTKKAGRPTGQQAGRQDGRQDGHAGLPTYRLAVTLILGPARLS